MCCFLDIKSYDCAITSVVNNFDPGSRLTKPANFEFINPYTGLALSEQLLPKI